MLHQLCSNFLHSPITALSVFSRLWLPNTNTDNFSVRAMMHKEGELEKKKNFVHWLTT